MSKSDSQFQEKVMSRFFAEREFLNPLILDTLMIV